MGSPEKPNKSTTSIIASTTSPQSAAFQDSPIFNYINNLSPIKPVKGTSVTQPFHGLNSPPLVFTSPQIHTHRNSIDLKRSPCHLTPLNNSANSPPKVADSLNMEGGHVENCSNEDDKGNNDAKENHEGKLPSCPKPIENNKEIGRSCQQSDLDNLSVQQYDQRVAQHVQPIFGNKISGIANEPILTMMERHSKVGQSQLGKRRRLQFETAQVKNVENDPGSQNPSNNANKSEVLESSCDNMESSMNVSQNVSKPSGIGLHLNSIVNARPSGNISIKLTKGSYCEKKSLVQNDMKCPLISSNSNLEGNVLVRSEEFKSETRVSFNNAKSMKMVEHQEKFDQVQADEFERSNSKKKRKKTESTGDGCKRCNCKKSKCLKLYCDCFAAGIYCAGPCSCQGCFNRPEYEETVLETRQLIESRNPLAFAPKIVHRLTQPQKIQTVEDVDQLTPVSGRHKKGCNCKKSMCLKKYCECYQSNVGCSDGCRCEGCQNIYGVKKGSGMNREIAMEAINEKLNDSFDDNLKVGPTGLKPSVPEFQKPHNLTPQTPSFQNSNHGKDPSKTRIFSGRYNPSPESESTLYLTTPISPKDSTFNIHTQQPQNNKNLETIPSFDQDPYPNCEFMDEFSPGPTLFSPLTFRGTLFGGTTKPYDDIIDDNDTPKILKESFTEFNKVKVRSPNKKRVSPPRIRLHELGSSSLKSGRKFILKAVPSFPPLTPCVDSKDHGQNQNDNTR